MKTLGKLNINHERVMKNEELVILKGGYSAVGCRIGNYHCWSGEAENCDGAARDKCDEKCPGWDNLVCAG